MKEYSLFGIKPDAFYPSSYTREKGSELQIFLPEGEKFVEEIKLNLREKGLEILQEKKYLVPAEIAKIHYQEHEGFFDENYGEYKQEFLVKYMTSGDSYWIVFYGENAITLGREILKNIRIKYLANPKLARYNMTHASDNPVGAKEEILLHFPKFSF